MPAVASRAGDAQELAAAFAADALGAELLAASQKIVALQSERTDLPRHLVLFGFDLGPLPLRLVAPAIHVEHSLEMVKKLLAPLEQ